MVDLVPNIVLNTHHNRRVNIFCPSVIRLVCRRCSIIISFCTLCLAMTMTEGWARDTGTGRARVLGRVVQWLGMRGGGGLSLRGSVDSGRVRASSSPAARWWGENERNRIGSMLYPAAAGWKRRSASAVVVVCCQFKVA